MQTGKRHEQTALYFPGEDKQEEQGTDRGGRGKRIARAAFAGAEGLIFDEPCCVLHVFLLENDSPVVVWVKGWLPRWSFLCIDVLLSKGCCLAWNAKADSGDVQKEIKDQSQDRSSIQWMHICIACASVSEEGGLRSH